MLEHFGRIAKQLSGNPLGIIALFLVLVYGIAGLVLGTAGKSLESFERLPIVWFLALFPVLVLFTFGWLVSRHHTKLYAPQDFQDSDTFLHTLDTETQIRRLNKDVEEVRETVKDSNDQDRESGTSYAIPKKVHELRQRLVIIQDLVMRELSAEFDANISREVGVKQDVGFDGMFTKDGKTFIVEVKYTASREWQRRLRESLVQVRNSVSHLKWRKVNVILCFVVDSESLEGLDHAQKRVADMASEQMPFEIDVRLMHARELLAKYGLGAEPAS